MRRSPLALVFALLALLASLAAPSTALTHGLAHHREHAHGPRTQPSGLEDGAPGERGHALMGTGGSPEQTALAPGEMHEHVVFDRPLPPRRDFAFAAVLVSAATVLLASERRVPTAMPTPHASLPRADPDAAPLPRLRAPPAI